ncbi:threonine aldolase family protein [Angelakisella massiliensis]|uniref:threonine aldolase family protein n=1 Tax=Angelakisella massiliensis TaxID=1871018 RepID=UPI0008F84720|nr:low specificity L-threonine aldolase [Angelakisella massiliensis]
MILFQCDYTHGAHPNIIERLAQTNLEQTPGYGEDHYCQEAAQLIRQACGGADLDVHFMVGGTQANFTVISSALRPYQGVLSAESGHINVHETGAVEACGYKVLPLPSSDGKITAQQVEQAVTAHWQDSTHEHIVQPGMVYISQPTEVGTIYTKEELTALSQVCRKFGLPLYADGARLACGLTAEGCGLTLADMARLCDAFTIGGTKMGALFGEAVVLTHPALRKDFRYLIKQKGGMLAKGRLLGIQFCELFQNDLYWQLGRHANSLAMEIRRACMEKGYPFLVDSPTNQQFPILPDSHLERLAEKYVYSYTQRMDESHSAVRFCTCWATRKEDVDQLAKDILAL